MAQTLLDTDILISVLRGVELVAHQMEDWQREGEMFSISTISVAELWQGMRSAEERPTQQLLLQMVCLPVNEGIGRLGGIYLHRYRRSHGITLADALIAATAVSYQIPLWTLNRRHYPMSELSLIR